MQYAGIKHLFKGKHFFAPVKNPLEILDIGTGTGKTFFAFNTVS